MCRSARTESANAENLRISKVFGTDLVECIGNAVTCSVCAQYRGRVFSVSGNDKRYPPLRDGVNSPLKNGYDIIHPNCRCEFRAYFESLHSKEENEAKRKFSNRPFDGDKRTVEQAKAYQELQRLNRQAVEEQSRWNEMQALLGKDMPYKNMASFRKAFRAEKDSAVYKASHNLKEDYQQYKEWQEIIDVENMPESLVEFQELKYNDTDKFDEVREIKDYILQLEQRRIVVKLTHNDRLPVVSEPNSIHDLEEDGVIKQRRIFDDKGKPKIDIDTNDHGMPKHHPEGGHKHYWKNGLRDKMPRELDDLDRTKNKDILGDKDD